MNRTAPRRRRYGDGLDLGKRAVRKMSPTIRRDKSEKRCAEAFRKQEPRQRHLLLSRAQKRKARKRGRVIAGSRHRALQPNIFSCVALR